MVFVGNEQLVLLIKDIVNDMVKNIPNIKTKEFPGENYFLVYNTKIQDLVNEYETNPKSKIMGKILGYLCKLPRYVSSANNIRIFIEGVWEYVFICGNEDLEKNEAKINKIYEKFKKSFDKLDLGYKTEIEIIRPRKINTDIFWTYVSLSNTDFINKINKEIFENNVKEIFENNVKDEWVKLIDYEITNYGWEITSNKAIEFSNKPIEFIELHRGWLEMINTLNVFFENTNLYYHNDKTIGKFNEIVEDLEKYYWDNPEKYDYETFKGLLVEKYDEFNDFIKTLKEEDLPDGNAWNKLFGNS